MARGQSDRLEWLTILSREPEIDRLLKLCLLILGRQHLYPGSLVERAHEALEPFLIEKRTPEEDARECVDVTALQ